MAFFPWIFFFHFAKAFVDCVWYRAGNFLFRREISCLFAQNFVVSVLRRSGNFFPYLRVYTDFSVFGGAVV